MGKQDNPAAKGYAAGKNGQDIGLENEETLLECIRMQGWVREREASLIASMSDYTVGVVGRRLKEKGEIFRERTHGNAGHFLRLTEKGAQRVGGKSGKDISIPDCWRHHALAIQSLHFLAGVHQCEFETEASMRRRIRDGKFPDGKLISRLLQFYFEQELSRKSGPNLRKQSEIIARLANEGFMCHVAYPYPPEMCGGIDHETRQTNSLRRIWGSPEASNIKLVRCHFESRLAFLNVNPSRFEVIDLPGMVNTPASRKPRPGITEQVMGFKWECRDINESGQPRCTEAKLTHNGVLKFEGVFFSAEGIVDPHYLEVDGWVKDKSFDEDQSFQDYLSGHMKRIENEIEAEMKSVVLDAITDV